MIDPARLAQAIRGLRLLLQLDTAGFSFFERSYPGFVRSFFPAFVLAPLHIAHGWLAYIARAEKPGVVVYAIVESLSYVMGWVLFPFVMMYVVRLLGRPERYFTYIVPYNWFQIVLGLVFMPLALLADLQVVGPDAVAFFNIMLVAALGMYGTFIARAALALPVTTALGVVLLDVVMALLSDAVIGKIYG